MFVALCCACVALSCMFVHCVASLVHSCALLRCLARTQWYGGKGVAAWLPYSRSLLHCRCSCLLHCRCHLVNFDLHCCCNCNKAQQTCNSCLRNATVFDIVQLFPAFLADHIFAELRLAKSGPFCRVFICLTLPSLKGCIRHDTFTSFRNDFAGWGGGGLGDFLGRQLDRAPGGAGPRGSRASVTLGWFPVGSTGYWSPRASLANANGEQGVWTLSTSWLGTNRCLKK